MSMEFERKYLIKELPPATSIYKIDLIQQGYFDLSSKYESLRVRMPLMNGPIYLTFKAGTGEAKTEIETEIPEATGLGLFRQTKYRLLKRRLHIIDPNWNRYHSDNAPVIFDSRIKMTLDLFYHSWEDDYFYGALFEAETPVKGMKIKLPEWIGKDVTEDPRYNNASIAKNGWPR